MLILFSATAAMLFQTEVVLELLLPTATCSAVVMESCAVVPAGFLHSDSLNDELVCSHSLLYQAFPQCKLFVFCKRDCSQLRSCQTPDSFADSLFARIKLCAKLGQGHGTDLELTKFAKRFL